MLQIIVDIPISTFSSILFEDYLTISGNNDRRHRYKSEAYLSSWDQNERSASEMFSRTAFLILQVTISPKCLPLLTEIYIFICIYA